MTTLGAGIGAAVTNAPAALTGTYVLLLVAMNLLLAVKPAWANHADPLQNMADLIGRQGSAAAHLALLAGWLLVATVAGWTIIVRASFAAVAGFVSFGLLSTLIWVRLDAIDVALTVAAIGSLSGALLLGAVARLRATESVMQAERPSPALRLVAAVLSTMTPKSSGSPKA